MNAINAAKHHPDPSLPRVYKIIARRQDLADTYSMDLVPADGGLPPRFSHGQFNMLGAFGGGEVPISISGDAARADIVTHTIRAVGGATIALEKLRKGDFVTLRGPYGRPWPFEELVGKDVLIIAGGVGLAPLRSTILGVLAARQKFGRVAVLYGTRSPQDLLFEDELLSWRGRFDTQVSVTVDRADYEWAGNVGVVTRLIKGLEISPEDTVSFVCGPEIMMSYSAQKLTDLGVAPQNIYLSMERNMRCAVGFCGHCQMAGKFVCKDGPVFSWQDLKKTLSVAEL